MLCLSKACASKFQRRWVEGEKQTGSKMMRDTVILALAGVFLLCAIQANAQPSSDYCTDSPGCQLDQDCVTATSNAQVCCNGARFYPFSPHRIRKIAKDSCPPL